MSRPKTGRIGKWVSRRRPEQPKLSQKFKNHAHASEHSEVSKPFSRMQMLGDNLPRSLRSLREARQISLRALAEQTGFSASFLSQIEHGQASPSIGSMERIATALGVTLAQFFHHAEGPQGIVIRRDHRDRMNLEWSLAEVEAAGSLNGKSQLNGVLVKLKAGGLSGKEPTPSHNDELVFVYKGEVALTLGETEHVLASGDSAVIPAGVKRRWRNDTEQPVQFLIVSAKFIP
jgi:transcriptional regulator with XRE-family HTH domain